MVKHRLAGGVHAGYNNAMKGDAVEDLNKAKWYIEREIARIGGAGENL